MLSIAAPPFNIQNPSHLQQSSMASNQMGLPQNINQQNQQMAIQTGPQQRYPMPANHMQSQVQQQQQQRSMLMRQGPNQPQLNSAQQNPSGLPMQAVPFPASMMQSQGQNPVNVRRVQSQPHMNPLGAPIPNTVSGAMQMAINPQTGMPTQIRQATSQQQQQQQHNQLRMQHQAHLMQQQSSIPNDIAALGMARQPPNPAMQQGVARTASGQPPMSSLPQPPMGGPSLSGGMQPPPLHQNSFPGSASMPPQHQPPPISSSPRPPQGLSPSPQSHGPWTHHRITPDNAHTFSFAGYNPAQFPGGNPGRPGPPGPSGAPGYGFAPSQTPPMPVGEASQTSPSGMMQGGAPNRANFSTQGSQFDMMGNNEVYPNFGMHPPTTVPPRPPSMGGPHQQPPGGPSQATQNMLQAQSQQANQQQQQQQAGSQQSSTPQHHNNQQSQQPQSQASQSHQSSPRVDQMNPHPQRPQSQPRHSTPGRPPSQAGGQQRNAPGSGIGPGPGPGAGAGSSTGPAGGNATGGPSQQPRTMGPVGLGAPLTVVGRIPQPQGAPTGVLPAIAPRPAGGMPSQNAQGGPSVIGGAPPNGVGEVAQPPLYRPMATMSSGTGQGVLRLLQFSGVLANESKMKLQLSYWNDLVKEYFTPKAIMKLTLWKDNQRNEAKPFEIGVPILPRFFLVTTQSGVKSMTLSLDGARERQFGQGHYVVECVGAIWTYKYTNGYIVTLRGPLTAHVLINATAPPGQPQGYTFRFEELQFDANFHDKYIALDSIAGKRSIDGRRSPIAEDGPSNSPGQGSQSSQSQSQHHKWEEPRIMLEGASIPGEPVNAFGIPQATMRCLELAESVSSMADLITFANETGLGPQAALKKLALKLRDGQQLHQPMGTMLPPNGHPAPVQPPTQPLMMNGMMHTGPPNGPLASPFQPFPAASTSNQSSVTLYSAAPPSVTNPQPTMNQSVNSPKNASASTSNSPDKQNSSIPQSMQMQMQHAHTPQQIPGPGSSPAISSGGTTNTPSMVHANPNLKRKQTGDAASPTIGNSSQEKRMRGPKRQKGPGS
ncbi:LIM-domain binding protein-domain-containing protein [Panaeolus papilionaceus]|nr:LIM-domain binding protein-domain-containing protein [Panaeolus papilionaceus]